MTTLSLLLLGLGVAACGGTTTSGAPVTKGAGGKVGGTLDIVNVNGILWSCNFTPFQPLPLNDGTLGIVYEPLVITNIANATQKPGVPTEYPWLASSYAWSKDNRTLTFRIRRGVKWSDGQAFSAADVLFTFQLIKKFPSLDMAGAWQSIDAVRQEGDKIVMSIKPEGIPGFNAIASNTYIVPQHIWSKVADPVKYVDRNPVGTGPFKVSRCSPQAVTYDRNPSYWQKGRPYVSRLVYPAYTTNATANRALATEPSAWGGQFVPNIKTAYLDKDPGNRHYWFPPVNNWNLTPNLTDPQLSDKRVRQAIAYAINRAEVAQKAEFGYTLPASQTGIVDPFKSWLNASAAGKYDYGYDPAKAKSLLAQAGYKPGSDGIMADSSGKKLSLSILVPGGYSDSVSAGQLMADQLRKVGIDARNEPVSNSTFGGRLANGQFSLAWGQAGYGPTPYYELRQLLHSDNTAPIGKAALTNYERWKSPSTDKLLDAYARTRNSSVQHKLVDQLQQVMLEDVPVIPVLQGVVWADWSDKEFAGWPTQDNPYAFPAPYVAPDIGVVLTRVRPR